MFNNILLSFDGSECAINAAKLAADLAFQQKEPGLWVVCVVESPNDNLQEPYQSQSIEKQLTKGVTLIKAASNIVGFGVTIKQEILFGDVAESILHVVETRNCDLIVMGIRGMSLVSEFLMGSKTQKVISQAKCPVLVTK